MQPNEALKKEGTIFDVQRFSVHDGPGIRTTVFVKGCPLRCLWCSNPESQEKGPELAFSASKCNKCQRCLKACELNALSLSEEKLKIDRKTCTVCGKCVEVCYDGALRILGRYVWVDDVIEEVKKDMLFYRNSAGGVTVSGGEPLDQPQFVSRLLSRCHRLGLHTTLDTCGHADPKSLEQVLPFVDLVLYDIKIMNPTAHKKFTGLDNRIILENARRIGKSGVPMIVRVPVIPEHSSGEDNLTAIVLFVSEMKGIKEIDLMPYHRLGLHKYQDLGKEYKLPTLEPPSNELIEELRKRVESYLFEVKIGG